jgi:hypothetical protein
MWLATDNMLLPDRINQQHSDSAARTNVTEVCLHVFFLDNSIDGTFVEANQEDVRIKSS